MRRIAGLILAIGLTAFAPAARAQSAAFVPLAPNRPDVAYFWDAASLKRTGDVAEVAILEVWARAPNATRDPVHSLTTYRISCDWSANLGMIRQVQYDSRGKAAGSSPGEAGPQQSFYGPHGWHVSVAPLACDPAYVAPAAPGSVGDAIALAAQAKRGSEKFPDKASALPGFPKPASSRYGVVKADKATGNVAFLDWGNIRRKDGKAVALVFEVLGDDSAPPPEPQWKFSVMALRSVTFDCTARKAAVLGYVSYGKYFDADSVDTTRWPVRSAADWPLGALYMDAACAGSAPAETFPTREAAVAFQRKLHPLRKS